VLHDDGVAAEREMRSVLFARADGYDESRIVAEHGSDLSRVELFDP
jgi:hypothetical protein